MEHASINVNVDYCNQYANEFDNLINIGSIAYDPITNKVVSEFNKDSRVGLFTITSSIFPQYQPANNNTYPLYPLLNRGIANNVSNDLYDIIRDVYKQCSLLVTQEYNTVLLNIGKGSIYKHRHLFAAPDRLPVITQVFAVRFTDYNEPNLEFRIYKGLEVDSEYESKSLNENCMMRFNGLHTHEVIATEDNNYYGYFVFEKWHE
jgi:hypothetical protein